MLEQEMVKLREESEKMCLAIFTGHLDQYMVHYTKAKALGETTEGRKKTEVEGDAEESVSPGGEGQERNNRLAVGTYEHWISQLHPENARSTRPGSGHEKIDHRFYLADSHHLRLWNAHVLVTPEQKVTPREAGIDPTDVLQTPVEAVAGDPGKGGIGTPLRQTNHPLAATSSRHPYHTKPDLVPKYVRATCICRHAPTHPSIPTGAPNSGKKNKQLAGGW